jgi:hypothetical protein
LKNLFLGNWNRVITMLAGLMTEFWSLLFMYEKKILS